MSSTNEFLLHDFKCSYCTRVHNATHECFPISLTDCHVNIEAHEVVVEEEEESDLQAQMSRFLLEIEEHTEENLICQPIVVSVPEVKSPRIKVIKKPRSNNRRSVQKSVSVFFQFPIYELKNLQILLLTMQIRNSFWRTSSETSYQFETSSNLQDQCYRQRLQVSWGSNPCNFYGTCVINHCATDTFASGAISTRIVPIVTNGIFFRQNIVGLVDFLQNRRIMFTSMFTEFEVLFTQLLSHVLLSGVGVRLQN